MKSTIRIEDENRVNPHRAHKSEKDPKLVETSRLQIKVVQAKKLGLQTNSRNQIVSQPVTQTNGTSSGTWKEESQQVISILMLIKVNDYKANLFVLQRKYFRYYMAIAIIWYCLCVQCFVWFIKESVT